NKGKIIITDDNEIVDVPAIKNDINEKKLILLYACIGLFIDLKAQYSYWTTLIIKINDKTYRTNSIASIFGRDHNKAYIGRFQNVFEIDNFLEIIIGHSDYVFYDRYLDQPLEFCVKEESVGYNKLLDYKWELYRILKDQGIQPNDLVAIDNIVYNANEIGNYIWAMVLSYHGILLNPNWIAEAGTKNRNDEPWEQKAIDRGKEKANKLEINRENVLQYRLEFRLLYEEVDKSWRDINPFIDFK
ncbi:MAG: hypothetical protein LBG15_15780, partial [Dysgonamonadaceae bacterium]|nr:hypothetical protein [Dysgonamonadaceae bacterium]